MISLEKLARRTAVDILLPVHDTATYAECLKSIPFSAK